MIQISVKSDFMEDNRVFTNNAKSIAYLKKVKKLHFTIAKSAAGLKPKRLEFKSYKLYKAAMARYNDLVIIKNLKLDIKHLN